jgi:hypothetical protein
MHSSSDWKIGLIEWQQQRIEELEQHVKFLYSELWRVSEPKRKRTPKRKGPEKS